MKNIALAAYTLIPLVAQARADIDLSDTGGDMHTWVLLSICGIVGLVSCHAHDELVKKHTESVNSLLKWVLGLALLLMILPIIGNLFGFNFDRYAGTFALSCWGVGKAAQGLYIGGVAVGIRGR